MISGASAVNSTAQSADDNSVRSSTTTIVIKSVVEPVYMTLNDNFTTAPVAGPPVAVLTTNTPPEQCSPSSFPPLYFSCESSGATGLCDFVDLAGASGGNTSGSSSCGGAAGPELTSMPTSLFIGDVVGDVSLCYGATGGDNDGLRLDDIDGTENIVLQYSDIGEETFSDEQCYDTLYDDNGVV